MAIQGYHLAEHTAEITQHLATAVDPAPGIFGDDLGLVWFHFGINLAVYAGMAAALLGLFRAGLRWEPVRPRGGEGDPVFVSVRAGP